MGSMLDNNYFSKDPDSYRQFRPEYPAELFRYLAMLCNEHELAWDVGTGSGQAAIGLAPHFEKVFASDISQPQLKSAIRKSNINYYMGSAENIKAVDGSIDIITVGQALHWFDVEQFFEQVDRVLKPGGILAVWCYELFNINADLDLIIHNLYQKKLKDYWPTERKLVENGYNDITLPYPLIPVPEFSMEQTWSFPQVIGYINTWTAVKNFIEQEEYNPVDQLLKKITFAWCDTGHMKKIKWPLNLMVCRKPD